MSTEPGCDNRAVFTGDNLEVMRSLASGSFDLIYLDPPFNTARRHVGKQGTLAEGSEFADSWSAAWTRNTPPDAPPDADAETETDDGEADDGGIGEVLRLTARRHSPGMAGYLAMMAPRLEEMRRLLADAGSIYLHCDHRASHYLRLVMDVIFGPDRMRNEIIWCYSNGGASPSRYAAKHDTILYYAKSDGCYFDTPRMPYTSAQSSDPRYTDLFHPDGKIMLDWWADLPPLVQNSNERVGYPTQKPLTLLTRIVQASCPPGGWVLDPFCGSGTTLIAAEALGRRWAGIDKSAAATDVCERRLLDRHGLFGQAVKTAVG